ncbi:hypothetical protein [Serratia marcescens]|uniref:hypothetical protein n=1 Tax=Serratia marcescens TaxID=615 RepID=UPI0027489E4B|nr:hypothetical protein [Serratia marcescens]MDP8640090.1 hypothetical protein [Serratia marcescens]
MKYGYSAKENSFYPLHLKMVYEDANNWPDDVVVVSEEVYKEFTVTRNDGYKRVASQNGMPSWINDVTTK